MKRYIKYNDKSLKAFDTLAIQSILNINSCCQLFDTLGSHFIVGNNLFIFLNH
jgi:hypothetical protein